MPIDINDPSNEDAKLVQQLSAMPPSLGSGLSGMTRVGSDLGFITGKTPGALPAPIPGPGRDASGTITAESAASVMGNDMQRSGGISGGIDMAGANAIMARENKARGEMIDLSIKANGGNGIAILGGDGPTDIERANAEKTARWRQDDLLSKARSNPSAGRVAEISANANGQAAIESMRQATAVRGQDANYAAQVAQQGITMRGQDLNALSDANRNQVTMRGQDLGATTDAQRIGIEQGKLQTANDRWGIEKGLIQGQVADADAVRGARSELSAAIALGDPAKIEAAKAKAVAAGVKFDKPNNEFTAVTDSMGMNITRTNKDTGAVDIIDGKSGSVKASIPAPGQRPAAQATAPAEAVAFLKQNPQQAAAFKAKYGYLPEGL